ncbi:MAG: hypothetical protein J0H35_03820, partial [Rhodospirillales bacterium]|nr:hypothetical protein [Rhodospirillales bacterium]
MAYGIAAAIGVTFVVTIVTLRLALGTGIDESFLTGDVTQHIVGQRYFIADAWRWPLLVTRLLEPPQGVNISLTDSIPLAALLTKLFRGMLPAGYTTIYPWLGVAFLLQPIAGVYALRGAGEKRLLPAALVALLALSMPTLLFRVGHIALCSHFLLLFAIGLYLRITADGRGRLGPVLLLLCASLLIHPYLLAMVATVLVAAPITLCLRRAPWATVAGQVAAALVATAGLALLLGYGGESPGSGFGRASMNLISPVYPFQSFLYQAIVGSPAPRVDATGLQYEGYQYLGAGVLLLLAVMLVTDPRAVGRSIRRHAGPWLIGVALTVLSV